MGKKDDKTNVMRILEQLKIDYEFFCFDNTVLNAEEISKKLGQNPKCVFKTLVTVAKSKQHYTFMVPANGELDLKKAAKAAGEKSIDMITQKELLPLTGYVHGGCSPIGMKKSFPTFIDESALGFDKIYFSAGRIGRQVCISPSDLEKAVKINFADISK